MDGGNLIGMRLWKGVRKVLRQLLDLRIRLKGREAKSNERHHMQAINMELSINIICVAGTSRVGAGRKRDTSLQEMNPYWHSFKEDTHNSRSSHGMSLVTRPNSKQHPRRQPHLKTGKSLRLASGVASPHPNWSF